MRIGIDARMFDESGVGRYIRNLLNNLQDLDNQNEYFIFLLSRNFNNLKLQNNFTKIKADFKWYGISEQLKFPTLLNKYKLDLVHFPHFNVPIFFKGKFIVTIHDLIHQHFQMRKATTYDPITYKIKQLGYKKIFNNAIKKSQKIIVPSNFVKNQLIKECNLKDSKIEVTYEAVDDQLLSIIKKVSSTSMDKVLTKFDIKLPYIFYVGNAHPHKNVEGLIKAFLEIRKKYQYLQLVLSGNDHYFWKRIKENYQDKNIIYTGFITDQELVALYKSAKVFVMPSFEEGFGIPLLEAFACLCPVVSSNKGSLPEVGKDTALYFDPSSREDMESKIMEVLNNNKLKEQLVKKGEEKYKEFSWEKLVQQTLKLYKEYS